MLEETLLVCEDEIIKYSFSLPEGWVLGITGILRPGETGVQYGYDLSRAISARPNKLQMGGVSWDFTDGREGLLTDFAGFETDSTTERCAQFQGALICEPITEEVIFMFLFPDAEGLCVDGQQFLGRPLALIAIDLPDNELINGFVLVGDYLSPALLENYEEDLADLLVTDNLAGEPCDAFRKSRFNVRMLELVAAVRNDILDEMTLDSVSEWRGVADSIFPIAE
jgi:hypothetical protein